MKLTPLYLSLLLALAACSDSPPPPKAETIKVEGDIAILAEPDKADFLKTATVNRDAGSSLRLPGRLVWN